MFLAKTYNLFVFLFSHFQPSYSHISLDHIFIH
uniref:Uncharacterized protein n=1 Tax=Siphoviridae sp. ctrCN24 TaxID=2827953 RepID=A0A8S5SKF1_9CAUD|nr:MAG TPA: hypothetical protein [Siphoviridae sp. ctrCN24]